MFRPTCSLPHLNLRIRLLHIADNRPATAICVHMLDPDKLLPAIAQAAENITAQTVDGASGAGQAGSA
jgi:hypothetical protein